jgi:hypothetical protein
MKVFMLILILMLGGLLFVDGGLEGLGPFDNRHGFRSNETVNVQYY